MVLNFQISFRAVLGLSSQLNFESFTIFCPYLGANSMFDVANVSKVSKLSFRGKILSKIGGFHFFFSQPEAGLTNQGHIWHCDTRVPLVRTWKNSASAEETLIYDVRIRSRR